MSREPTRERLTGQLMLALYRSGRQADALAAYRTLRGSLIEELGLEPGPRTGRRETAVLAQDPALDLPPDRPPAPLAARRATTAPPMAQTPAGSAAAALLPPRQPSP